MNPSRDALARAGLIAVATGILSFVSVRGYLEESVATARDLTLGFSAFIALVLLAAARTPPRWSALVAFVLIVVAFVWSTTISLGFDLRIAAVVAVTLAFVAVEAAYRVLVAAGFALATPALYLTGAGVEAIVAVAAWSALAFLVVAALVRRGEPSAYLRRISLALLGVAIVSAVLERHTVVASRVLAPDDLMAVVALMVLAILAVARPPSRVDFALTVGVTLAAFALVGVAFIVGKGYHVDAVTSPHYAAELLLQGKNPYVAFDMLDSLARFGLPPTLATKLEDGSLLRSHNYPAGGFLLVTPFVWAGLTDMRWVYLGEVLLLVTLLASRARLPWRPLVVALAVGNTLLTRQYVLAGIDPTWALGVAVAWLFVERRWLSPVALGLGCASRQPAWLFVPFYLLATWKLDGPREALRRGVVVAAAFLIPNLPFVAAAPLAWFNSVFDPLISPLEPYGVGIVRLGLLGPLPLFPRSVYTVLMIAVFALLVVILWKGWRRLLNGAVAFPLVPLFFGWRSLMNYFVFLPVLAILRDDELLGGDRPPNDTESLS